MWLYKNKEFTPDMIGDYYGFVYVITNTTNNKKYIGRKYFWSKRTLPPLAGKTRRRHVKMESNWKDYWSSSKILKEEIDKHGKENFTREIISLHHDKRETNYAELAEQVINNVLEALDCDGNRLYYNENILSKYYSSKKYGEQRIVEHESRIKNVLID